MHAALGCSFRSCILKLYQQSITPRVSKPLGHVCLFQLQFFISQTLPKSLDAMQQVLRYKIMPAVTKVVMQKILSSTQAFLCTIDAAARMDSELIDAEVCRFVELSQIYLFDVL